MRVAADRGRPVYLLEEARTDEEQQRVVASVGARLMGDGWHATAYEIPGVGRIVMTGRDSAGNPIWMYRTSDQTWHIYNSSSTLAPKLDPEVKPPTYWRFDVD